MCAACGCNALEEEASVVEGSMSKKACFSKTKAVFDEVEKVDGEGWNLGSGCSWGEVLKWLRRCNDGSLKGDTR